MTSRHAAIAWCEDAEVIDVEQLPDDRRSSEYVVSAAAALLDRNDVFPANVEAVYVSRGPGGFTGTRVAATLAKMLCDAVDAKLVGVDTFDVVVQRLDPKGRACVVFDARRGDVRIRQYAARDGRWSAIGDSELLPAVQVTRVVPTDATLIGEGVSYHAEALSAFDVASDYWPKVEHVAVLGHDKLLRGEAEDPMTFLPRYVRVPQAVEKLREAVA